MKLATLAAAALVAVVAITATPATAKRRNPDPTAVLLGDLSTAARCNEKASPFRPWCIAADGWASGTVVKPPVGKVLVGITIRRTTAATAPWDLAADPTIGLAALVVRRDGPAVELRLADINPTKDDEKPQIADALANVSTVLKGKGSTVKVPPPLAAYLKSLSKKSGHVATKGATGWTWSAGKDMPLGELRKVGKFWVVIETPTAGAEGRFITVLTEKWK